jgi:hypothetical protein
MALVKEGGRFSPPRTPGLAPAASPGPTCPDCGGRLQIIAFVTDDAVARRILSLDYEAALQSRG